MTSSRPLRSRTLAVIDAPNRPPQPAALPLRRPARLTVGSPRAKTPTSPVSVSTPAARHQRAMAPPAARQPSWGTARLLAAVVAAAAVATAAPAEPLDHLFVEALIYDSTVFKAQQDAYGRLHGLFDRMQLSVDERLNTVQRDFDRQATHVLQVDERIGEKLARAEMAMTELIASVRAVTVDHASSSWYRVPYLVLGVFLTGLAVQFTFLRATVKRVGRAGPLLGGFRAASPRGAGAAWV